MVPEGEEDHLPLALELLDATVAALEAAGAVVGAFRGLRHPNLAGESVDLPRLAEPAGVAGGSGIPPRLKGAVRLEALGSQVEVEGLVLLQGTPELCLSSSEEEAPRKTAEGRKKKLPASWGSSRLGSLPVKAQKFKDGHTGGSSSSPN